MKKLKAIFFSGAIVLMSGCALLDKILPAPKPNDVIREMITTMQKVTSAGYDVTANIVEKSTSELNNLEVQADVVATGVSDNTDKTNPALTLNLTADVTSNDSTQGEMKANLIVDLTVVEKEVYFKLSKLVLPAELQTQLDPMISTYQGQWFKMPGNLLPEKVQSKLNQDAQIVAQKDKIEELVRNTDFFNVLSSKTEGNNYVYNVKFNPENLKAFLKSAGEITGESINNEDLAIFDINNPNLEYDLTLSIDKSNHYLNQFAGNLTLLNPTNETNLKMTGTVKFNNFNVAPEIVAPAGAQDFNPMALLGVAGMMNNSSSTDAEAMDTAEADVTVDVVSPPLEGMDLETLPGEMPEMPEMPAEIK